jgi:hypothetical protein
MRSSSPVEYPRSRHFATPTNKNSLAAPYLLGPNAAVSEKTSSRQLVNRANSPGLPDG